MRRILAAATSVFALTPVSGVAIAHVATSQGGKGVIQRSWVSEVSGGPGVSEFNLASVQRVYANFVWATGSSTSNRLERLIWRGARRLGESYGSGRPQWNASLRLGRRGATETVARDLARGPHGRGHSAQHEDVPCSHVGRAQATRNHASLARAS
jgi:hypothetical protein